MAIIRWGSETEITEITWLWKPLIPFGKVTIIEGDGGDGKTTMILTIAAMLSRGTLPPTLQEGRLVPADEIVPSTTFYLTNEDEIPDSSLKRFLRAGGNPAHFAYSGEMEHHVTLQEEELRQIIADTGARMIIIDPFQAFLPEGTSLGSVTSMRTVFTMLSKVAKSTGTAIVLIGHLNKNEYSKDIHRGLGSADIAASVRSLLLVEKDEHGRHFVQAIKSNFDESDYTRIQLCFDENRKLFFNIPGTEEADDDESEEMAQEEREPEGAATLSSRRTKTEIAEIVIRSLLQVGPCTIGVIRAFMNEKKISRKTVQRAARNVGAELKYVDGVAYWQIPGSAQSGPEQVETGSCCMPIR